MFLTNNIAKKEISHLIKFCFHKPLAINLNLNTIKKESIKGNQPQKPIA